MLIKQAVLNCWKKKKQSYVYGGLGQDVSFFDHEALQLIIKPHIDTLFIKNPQNN